MTMNRSMPSGNSLPSPVGARTEIGRRPALFTILSILLCGFTVLAEETKPVSYFGDIVPIFKKSCTGCHHPGKLKGNLDFSIYGASFSPDGERIAVGCADKTVRIFAIKDGKELLKFDNHTDWVLGTAFTVDGKRLVSASRDRAIKLIDSANSQFIDDINKLLEEIVCLARHPKLDQVAYGGAMGTPRLYRISDNQGRTAANNDVNLVREFERQPGPIYAVAFSPDGILLAFGGVANEVRIYKTGDGTRAATLKGHEGAIFSLAFHPSKNEIVTAGFDGKVRIYDSANAHLINTFLPVLIKSGQQVANAAPASPSSNP